MRDNDNDETSKVKLGQEQAADGTSKPVVYVLMPDGETTTFKDRALLLPGAGSEPVGDVYAVPNQCQW